VRHLDPVVVQHVRLCAFRKKPGGARGCAECGAAKADMRHVGTPASLNVHGSGANQYVYQAQKKAWAARLTELMEREGLPRPLVRVLAEGELIFPDRRKRDQGNYRFMLEKALGDALQEGGWLEDDDWDHYEFGGLRYSHEPGESATVVILHPEAPEEA
jgi:hypothetical protein